MQKILTRNSEETKNLAKLLAMEIRGGEIICLSGDLGAGKTTFTQGLLETLGAEGPYTSPTFAIMKEYDLKDNKVQETSDKKTSDFKIPNLAYRQAGSKFQIHHLDVYRVDEKDVLELGWKDFAGKENAVTIVEWPERIKNLIPTGSLWIDFKWIDENQREITISQKH